MKALTINKMCGGRAATEVRDIPYPVCGEKQVIIKVMSASICKHCEEGYDNGMQGLTKEEDYPIVTGHEFAGEVVEVGSAVRNIKVGDRVTVDNTVLCGECYYCQKDEPLYCENFGSMGHNIHGGFEEYTVALAEKCFKISEGISYEEASIVEPIACCLRAVDRSEVQFGDTVAVLGAGSMGMILAQLFKHSNARKVVVLASTQSKLDIIEKEFGIETILVDRSDYSKHQKKLKEMFPHGLNIVCDSTGAGDLVNSMFPVMDHGSKLVTYTVIGGMVGNKGFVIEDPYLVQSMEISFIPAWCQTHNFGRCIDALADGRLNMKPLITHEFALEDYFEALDTNLKDRNSVKVLIHPNWEKGRKVVHINE